MDNTDRTGILTQDLQEQFFALLAPLLDRLSRFALALIHDEEEARDLVGDAILIAYERFSEFRAPEAFRSYLFLIVRRLCHRRSRRKKLAAVFRMSLTEESVHPEEQLGLQLDVAVLERALDRLPQKQRETVILFDIAELSLEEVRKIQGGSLSGVKSRLARGRERLAELIGEGETSERKKSETSKSTSVTHTPFLKQGANGTDGLTYLLTEKL